MDPPWGNKLSYHYIYVCVCTTGLCIHNNLVRLLDKAHWSRKFQYCKNLIELKRIHDPILSGNRFIIRLQAIPREAGGDMKHSLSARLLP